MIQRGDRVRVHFPDFTLTGTVASEPHIHYADRLRDRVDVALAPVVLDGETDAVGYVCERDPFNPVDKPEA